MRHLLIACLPLLGLAGFTSAADLEILVSTEDGWAPAVNSAPLVDQANTWLLPIATRSEVVQTLEDSNDGFGLRVYSRGFVTIDNLTLAAVAHAADEQVLILDGQLSIVGPPTLLANDPALARQDAVLGPAKETSLNAAPEGLVVIGIPGTRDTRSARRIQATQLSAWSFDQVFAAKVRPVDLRTGAVPVRIASTTLVDTSRRRTDEATKPSIHAFGLAHFGLEETLELPADLSSFKSRAIGRGRSIEIFFEAPPAQSGQTHTLVLRAWTTETSAPTHVPAPWTKSIEPKPAPLFADTMAPFAGEFVHLEGPADQRDIRPTMGPGAAAADVNGDGWLDLYLVQGGGREGQAAPTARLSIQVDPAPGLPRPVLRTQVKSGLNVPGHGMGALFFDADGDGDQDLYQANYGMDFMFANRWGQRSEGQTPFVAVGASDFERPLTAGWSAGLTAGDIDMDGDLDLYITSYLEYDEANMPDDGELDRYSREDPIAMLPFAFPGARNLLLINESTNKIHMRDGTDQYDLADEGGRGMQPVFWDFDGDGDLDLYVANDVSPNRLWRNEHIGAAGGKGRGFKDVAFSTGMDDPRGGMGVDVGDIDGDLDEDLMLTNWQLEPNALYRSNLRRKGGKLHHASFQDVIVRSGLAGSGIGTTSWGAILFDGDNDSDLDLFVANGYTSPDYRTTGICVGQANQYFENDGTGRFIDQSEIAGPAVLKQLPSRAALAADFDQDGDLDLVVTTNNGPAQLLTNQHRQLPNPGNYLTVRLRGTTKNTRAIGARVKLTSIDDDGNERVQMRSLISGKNYLASNPPELFFGLGTHTKVKLIEVTWPSGQTSEHGPGPVNQILVLKEQR